MIAQELVNDLIPPLKVTDKVKKALGWMEELRVSQLPVVHDGAFLGYVSEDVLFDSNEVDKAVGNLKLLGNQCFVLHYQHYFDIIKIASEQQFDVVAVLDAEHNYLGAVTLDDTLHLIAQSATIQSEGGVLVLSVEGFNYSLAELSRLIEADGAKILGTSLQADPAEPGNLKLTLKLNKTDLSRIIATLERFGYRIDARFQEEVAISNERERLDILLRYLDI